MEPMRPRFELVVPFTPEEVRARLEGQLACPRCPCRLDVLGRHVQVRIAEDRRRIWSPWLTLEVGPDEGGARLHGLFGPNPSFWTGIMAAYGAIGFATLFASMLGVSQLQMGKTPWALLALPIGLVLAAAPYAAARVGQRLAADQMELLRCFLGSALGLGVPEQAFERPATCPEAAAGPPGLEAGSGAAPC